MESKVESQIRSTSRIKKKETKHASPPIMPLKSAPTLRLPLCNLLSDPRIIFVNILACNIIRYYIYSPYYYYTYNLNILNIHIKILISFVGTGCDKV
jgi:hypothetical protein